MLFLLITVPLLCLLAVLISSKKSFLIGTKAQFTPGCLLSLTSKNEFNQNQRYFYLTNGYAAMEKNFSIQLQASCWGFTDKAVYRWNFGDNACTVWEAKGRVSASMYRYYHTYTKNGDYTVTFSLKEGVKNYLGTFKLGIYDRTPYASNINLSVTYQGNGQATKEFVLGNTSTDTRIGGFLERLCTFTGSVSNLSAKQTPGDFAYREVVPINTSGTYLTTYRVYKNESGTIWNDLSCQLSNISNFYDRFGVKGNVNRLSYKIKGLKLNGATATLNVGQIELATRKSTEYTTTTSCIPK